jgi:hypothetical protein
MRKRISAQCGAGRLAGFYLSAMTSISKSSGVNASVRLNWPSFAPWMAIVRKPRDLSSQVISEGV